MTKPLGMYQLLLCGLAFDLITHACPLLPHAWLSPTPSLCHQDVVHTERQSNSKANCVKIGSLTRGGWRKWLVLSCLVCSGRGRRLATLGLSGLTEDTNANTESLVWVVSLAVGCAYSCWGNSVCGQSDIKMRIASRKRQTDIFV